MYGWSVVPVASRQKKRFSLPVMVHETCTAGLKQSGLCPMPLGPENLGPEKGMFLCRIAASFSFSGSCQRQGTAVVSHLRRERSGGCEDEHHTRAKVTVSTAASIPAWVVLLRRCQCKVKYPRRLPLSWSGAHALVCVVAGRLVSGACGGRLLAAASSGRAFRGSR